MSATTTLPKGFAVRLGADTRSQDRGRALFGGANGRVVYLGARAAGALTGAGEMTVRDEVTASLARLLLDRGLADPWWPARGRRPFADEAAPEGLLDGLVDDVTVVVPVRDRCDQLARLLAAVPGHVGVVVVDDGSADPRGTDELADRFGATVVRHAHSQGPAAARNSGLAQVSTGFVVFLDSDVVPVAGWLHAMRRHFEDPAVGIVGARVLGMAPAAGDTWLCRYEAARSSLDLGPRPAAVQPHGRVAYLPSAALMARREAVPDGFDSSLYVAEDVDLVWRAHASGWRVRYEPLAVVRHEHRVRTRAWLRRKVFYGTGASLLAQRHASAVAPMVLTPWTAALAVLVLAQRRWSFVAAGLVCVGVTARISARLSRSEHPVRTGARLTAIGAAAALRQTASAVTRHYWPLAVLAAARGPRARRALLVAAVTEAMLDYRRVRPDLDPARFLAARRLDDLGYGAGLWIGAWRSRSGRALVPVVRGWKSPTRKVS